MKKRSLLIVVALLCMASLMAAMAFTSAQIGNSMTFAVVATDVAKIGISENSNHAGVAKIVNNKMVLDFSPGMQPGSTYKYDDLFYVTNNTDKTIYVGLRFDSCYAGSNPVTNFPVGLHTVYASDDSNKLKKLYTPFSDYADALILGGPEFRSGAYEGRMIELAPNEKVGIDFNFNINSSSGLMNKTISLQVLAKDSPDGSWN